MPSVPYEIADWVYKHAVNLDCHVVYKTNRYSAPYKYVGKKVDLKITDSLVEIYHKSERICSHKKLPDYAKYKWSTNEEHMPDQFHHTSWDDERIKKWASSIGPFTSEVINRIFASVRIKEQGYNSSLSILRLSKTYSEERLELASELVLDQIKSPRYRNLKAVLVANQDEIFKSQKNKNSIKELNKSVKGYVRGPEYYTGGDSQ